MDRGGRKRFTRWGALFHYPLLEEFFDKNLPLPTVEWKTVPSGIDPWLVWDGYDESVEGWVPVWFPTHEPLSGRSYGEFERAALFNEELERVLTEMHRWPLWGSPTQKKHASAIALLQLFCEMGSLGPGLERCYGPE